MKKYDEKMKKAKKETAEIDENREKGLSRSLLLEKLIEQINKSPTDIKKELSKPKELLTND